MKRYYLRLRALSPLTISGQQNIDGQTNTTLDYIPGSTLRGALVWHWLRQQPAARGTPEFTRLVEEGGLRCTPLYPYSRDRRTHSRPSLPLPATARTCKVYPGFISDLFGPAPGEVHGVRDMLAALVEERTLQHWQAEGKPLPAGVRGLDAFAECRIEGCHGAMERAGGYYVSASADAQAQFWQTSIRHRLVTRTAILPQLESTQPGALFSREAIEAGQEFAGWLFVDDEHPSLIEQLLVTGQELYIGAARTAGQGRMQVDICEEDWGLWEGMVGGLDQRLANFTTRLAPDVCNAHTFVPLTLLSDTILLDQKLRYAGALTPDLLNGYQHLETELHSRRSANANPSHPLTPPPPWPADVELFVSVARMHRISTWNTAPAARRPRSEDWAVAAGSVFVLAAPSNQAAQLSAACRWLEEHGIGERREEGFGQLLVAHPFHALEKEV